ncbi:hypothetical protein Tco_0266543 [Tanacetum coccineum]
MASTAAKPCQEDSSEFYLITGSIYTDQQGTVVFPMVAATRGKPIHLHLVAAIQHQPSYYPKSQPNYNPSPSSTRSQAAIRSKGKEIARAPSPPTEYETKIVNDTVYTPRDKEIDRLMTLISTSFKRIYKPTNNNLRTSSNTRNKNVEPTPRTRCERQTRQYENQRATNVQDLDEEPTNQELEAHYLYKAKIQELIPNAGKGTGPIFDKEPLKQCDSNTTPDSSDMSNNRGEADQDEQKFQEERALLASLIEQIKREIDKNKKNKSLESSNKNFQEANTSLVKQLEGYKDMKHVKEAETKYAIANGLIEETKIKTNKPLALHISVSEPKRAVTVLLHQTPLSGNIEVETQNMNTSVSKTLDITSRLNNISEPTNDKGSNLSSSTLSSNSFTANRGYPIHHQLWVHSTFHVSNLKKCLSDKPLAVPLDEIHIDDKLHFVEEPVEILDREVKKLRQSRISIIKVRWNTKRGPEFTWEREDQFREKYPHLFTKTAPSKKLHY